MSNIPWFPTNAETYSLDEARKKFEVKDLGEGAYLILHGLDADRYWLHFAVMEWNSSDGDGNNVELSCVFHGEGPPTHLRECRHTWWGDNGYIFYPKLKTIMLGLNALQEKLAELEAELADVRKYKQLFHDEHEMRLSLEAENARLSEAEQLLELVDSHCCASDFIDSQWLRRRISDYRARSR